MPKNKKEIGPENRKKRKIAEKNVTDKQYAVCLDRIMDHYSREIYPELFILIDKLEDFITGEDEANQYKRILLKLRQLYINYNLGLSTREETHLQYGELSKKHTRIIGSGYETDSEIEAEIAAISKSIKAELGASEQIDYNHAVYQANLLIKLASVLNPKLRNDESEEPASTHDNSTNSNDILEVKPHEVKTKAKDLILVFLKKSCKPEEYLIIVNKFENNDFDLGSYKAIELALAKLNEASLKPFINEKQVIDSNRAYCFEALADKNYDIACAEDELGSLAYEKINHLQTAENYYGQAIEILQQSANQNMGKSDDIIRGPLTILLKIKISLLSVYKELALCYHMQGTEESEKSKQNYLDKIAATIANKAFISEYDRLDQINANGNYEDNPSESYSQTIEDFSKDEVNKYLLTESTDPAIDSQPEQEIVPDEENEPIDLNESYESDINNNDQNQTENTEVNALQMPLIDLNYCSPDQSEKECSPKDDIASIEVAVEFEGQPINLNESPKPVSTISPGIHTHSMFAPPGPTNSSTPQIKLINAITDALNIPNRRNINEFASQLLSRFVGAGYRSRSNQQNRVEPKKLFDIASALMLESAIALDGENEYAKDVLSDLIKMNSRKKHDSTIYIKESKEKLNEISVTDYVKDIVDDYIETLESEYPNIKDDILEAIYKKLEEKSFFRQAKKLSL